MRIVQMEDGRYIKILSPQMEGLIGKLYKEVQERKSADEEQKTTLELHDNKMTVITSQMETMLIRYAEITNILRKLFPEDEPIANIDRPLVVDGSVKANTFIATEQEKSPLVVTSQKLVDNLNVEFVGGKSLAAIEEDVDQKIEDLDTDITRRIEDQNQVNTESFAPIEHVNAGGVGVHPYATTSLAGFMSPVDKLEHDRMKQELDMIDLPGGMSIGDQKPTAPKMMQLWIDTN